MKKLFLVSLLCSVSACAFGPPVPTTPVTPVFFQPASATLDSSALATIAAFAKAAAEEPQAQVIVTGATDQTGTTSANDDLSFARARIVSDALVQDGVAAERIHRRAMGEADSAYGDAAQSGRRVLLRLVN